MSDETTATSPMTQTGEAGNGDLPVFAETATAGTAMTDRMTESATNGASITVPPAADDSANGADVDFSTPPLSLGTAASAETLAGATAAAVAAPEPEIEEMPPLDQIEVPGSGGDDRRGGGGGRGRGGRGGGGRDNFDPGGRELNAGEVVTGTVVHIDHEGVLVDVGTKSEGLIRPNELSREPVQNMEDVVKVGDKVDVVVLDPAGRDGNLLLSKKRADFEKAWDRVQEALGDGRTMQAMVTDRVKGGLVVDLGIRGFVPASHVGNGKLKNLEKFVGQSVPLKVLEVDREHRKVVLSHRLATEEERAKQKEDTIGSLAEGQTRTGTVRRVTDYGAFVDLGGIDGLLHVSEMSWTRVKHPNDVVKVGDQIQVMILKLNLDQGRVSLGLRQILPDPWTTVAERYHVGDTVEGEVTRLVPFGAFVLLEGDVEGIIPNSELAHRRIAKPADVVESGQRVEVKVIDVRPEERRLTLSLRALQPRDAEPERRPAPAVGPDGVTPAPGATEDAGARRERRDRRRGRDDDGGTGTGGGGDYRQFLPSEGARVTIGDMFGDMLAGRGSRSGGGGGGRGAGRRGRTQEEEDEDLSNIDDDIDLDTATTDDETAETDTADSTAEVDTTETA